ncbi:MAG: hypothetical protein RI898_719, partial [Actinomycetota bacterium]
GHAWGAFVMRWLHVVSGIMWIGLLWYFNFVQIPSMPKIPDEQKPAIGKVIAPTALFWFRYAALATVATGVLVAWMNGYLVDALALRQPFHAIGIGMWIALLMAFNVWFIIWPNLQKALGLVEVSPEEKPVAARTAMITSRINTMLDEIEEPLRRIMPQVGTAMNAMASMGEVAAQLGDLTKRLGPLTTLAENAGGLFGFRPTKASTPTATSSSPQTES